MQKLADFLTLLDSYLGSSSWFVYFLVGTGLFFTIYLGFPQIRFFRHAIDVVRGKFDNDNDMGDTSHFGALATALSGTIGTGNIAGVALAIHLGGAAAIFWMLVTAFLGMTTKMVEVTLSHKYRDVAEDGTIAGGPMYYMKNRLKMKPLAVIFSIATIISAFGTGVFPQINGITTSFEAVFGFNKMVVGAVLALFLMLVIIGGIKRISQVTAKLVPIMTIVYILGIFSVLILHYDNIIPSITSIFTDVFTGSAATGGFLGAGFALAFNKGVNRGLFSNEAGQGSAPIAHAAARTSEPMSEGFVAILEPFIDTIVVCFITAVVVLSSGVWSEKYVNEFQNADLQFVEGLYSDKSSEQQKLLAKFINNEENSEINAFNGVLNVENGSLAEEQNVTIINSRSVAEDVEISRSRVPFTGQIEIENGRLKSPKVAFSGKSLLHSAPLTTKAFGMGILGDFGRYIIPISLLLFAFSTSISWSYYGDRAVIFLAGIKWVLPFRILYVIAFFFGGFLDTTLLWSFTGVSIALMTIPNLVGILLLRKDIKKELTEYVVNTQKSAK